MSTAIDFLARQCRNWGGELMILSTNGFDHARRQRGRTTHPDGGHAIDVGRRLVFVDRDRVNPGTVIHEMGHVFLDQGRPDDTHEPDWLGWEIVLARRARCFRTWSRQNHDYILPRCGVEWSDVEWGDLRGADLRRAIADRVAHAKKLGIVSQDGVPLCTRGAA